MQQPLTTEETLSTRQKEVLDAALDLLVEGDGSLTMASVARKANCSKETLYKWFNDREGFLDAMVRWQASRVRVVPLKRGAVEYETLFSSIEHFARDWLMVLSGEKSIALNRLAVTDAGKDQSSLGMVVLQNGPFAMARRLKPVLELGCEAGHLVIEDLEEAFRTFFGLVVRDMQIRLLLGEHLNMDDAKIIREARRATRHFFTLYGVEPFQTNKTHN